MKKTVLRLISLALVLAFAAFAAMGYPSKSSAAVSLPKSMVWTSYDISASGYIHAAAMADALNKKFGTNVRIIPSGNSMGRIIPLMQGKANYAFLGDEAMFAFEGIYDFAVITWGPQNIRTLLANQSVISFFTTKASYDKGLRTPADFAGKRVPYIPGSPTTNVKVDAFLAYAGLTKNDVIIVEFPNFTANNRGLIERTVDLGIAVPTGPILYEIESSPTGLYRIEFPASETTAWARFNKIFPTFFPKKVTNIGPAIHRESGIEEVGFRFPHIVTYAGTSDDEAYALTKAFVETYDLYKSVDDLSEYWKVKLSSSTPASAPFHPGSVRYFKEIGIWSNKQEEWNNWAIKKAELLQKTWTAAVEEATAVKMKEADFPAFWEAKRQKALETITR